VLSPDPWSGGLASRLDAAAPAAPQRLGRAWLLTPKNLDGSSEGFCSEGTHLTMARDPVISRIPANSRQVVLSRTEAALPFVTASANGRLSTKYNCLVLMLEIFLAWCFTDQMNARPSVRNMFSLKVHRLLCKTFQSDTSNRLGSTGANWA
jgi:hypothetical protein